MPQNNLGDLIDHVYATSDKTIADPTALSAKIRDVLPYHSDSSDVVGLMCLRPAHEGAPRASCRARRSTTRSSNAAPTSLR